MCPVVWPASGAQAGAAGLTDVSEVRRCTYVGYGQAVGTVHSVCGLWWSECGAGPGLNGGGHKLQTPVCNGE